MLLRQFWKQTGRIWPLVLGSPLIRSHTILQGQWASCGEPHPASSAGSDWWRVGMKGSPTLLVASLCFPPPPFVILYLFSLYLFCVFFIFFLLIFIILYFSCSSLMIIFTHLLVIFHLLNNEIVVLLTIFLEKKTGQQKGLLLILDRIWWKKFSPASIQYKSTQDAAKAKTYPLRAQIIR